MKVYFQPPNNVTLEYPCVIYNRQRPEVQFAGNKKYLYRQGYSATLIDREVDSPLIAKILSLNYSSHERWFAVDDLNHDVFNLYF